MDPRLLLGPSFRSHATVGFDPRYVSDSDPRIAREFERLFSVLKDLGLKLAEVSLPKPEEVLPPHITMFACESAALYLRDYAEHQEAFPPVAKWMFDHMRSLTPYDYVLAAQDRKRFRRAVNALFESVDLIVTPTIPVAEPGTQAESFEIAGKSVEFTPALIRFTALFDHTGHPALAMPFAHLGASTAASLQIVGPIGSDRAVLELGAKIERTLNIEISRNLALK
jgi:Asp-tRNA(Asn)/Glu-tRNA(Gln) amidotransferase A subunit family amidase